MNTKKTYFENLDASRFFAFIIVFLAHGFIAVSPQIEQNGFFIDVKAWGKLGLLGLEYFFVLSSFLISWIILEEKKQTNNFNVKNFLLRRTLRVWPLYFLIVGLGFGLFYGAQLYQIELSPLPPLYNFLLFIVNFYIISHGTEFLFFLAFLWSISIEEQFYLFWAFIMKFIKINLAWLCSILIGISIAFRTYYLGEGSSMYFHTVSALGNFGVGGIAAYIAFHKTSLFDRVISLGKNVNRILYLILLLSIVFFHQLNQFDLFNVFSRLYFSLLFGFYILEQAFGKNRVFNGGKIKWFSYLGKISYGLYCFHGVVITILIKVLERMNFGETIWHSFIIYPLIIIICTIGLATLSYEYFEKYFLKLKSKFYTFTA